MIDEKIKSTQTRHEAQLKEAIDKSYIADELIGVEMEHKSQLSKEILPLRSAFEQEVNNFQQSWQRRIKTANMFLSNDEGMKNITVKKVSFDSNAQLKDSDLHVEELVGSGLTWLGEKHFEKSFPIAPLVIPFG